jgi:hypothetical protein
MLLLRTLLAAPLAEVGHGHETAVVRLAIVDFQNGLSRFRTLVT